MTITPETGADAGHPRIDQAHAVTAPPPAEPIAPERTARFYGRMIDALQAAEQPFLIGGAYSFARYTGIERHTKDLDIFVLPADVERTLAILAEAGCDVVVPEERATLVSWRVPADESADVVSRLAEADVIVRDLPGRGLVRASVGWWTSEDDLDRLVGALPR